MPQPRPDREVNMRAAFRNSFSEVALLIIFFAISRVTRTNSGVTAFTTSIRKRDHLT